MKRALISISLVACAPHFDRAAHSGRDGNVWGANRLEFWDNEGRARGIVTARGGDGDDWYAFEVPENLSCPHVEVGLRWRPPRPGLRLALAVYDQKQHRVTRVRHAYRSNRASFEAERGGRYFAKVSALGRDDAGDYRLDVQAEPTACEPPTLPPPIRLVPPAGYQPPAIAPSLDHEVAGVTSITINGDRYRGTVTIAAGTERGIDEHWSGHLVDDRGVAVPRSAFVVYGSAAGTSSADLLDADAVASAAQQGTSLWTAVLEGPPPQTPAPMDPIEPSSRPKQTVDALVSSVQGLSSGDVLVELDRGRADGVELGWKGELAYASGVRVPRGRFVVIDVAFHRSIGLVTQLVITDPDHLHAVLTSP